MMRTRLFNPLKILIIVAVSFSVAQLAVRSGSGDEKSFSGDIPARRDSYRNIGTGTLYKLESRPGLGKASATSADRLEAGRTFKLTLEYTVGDVPLGPGDGVLVVIPNLFSGPAYVDPVLSSERQHLFAGAGREILMKEGFTTFGASNPGVRLGGFCDRTLDRSRVGEGWHLYVGVMKGSLQPNEKITIRYGDDVYGSPGAVTPVSQVFEIPFIVFRQMNWQAVETAVKSRKRIAVCESAQACYQLEKSPLAEVHGSEPEKLVVTGPSFVQAGESFELIVVARDRFDNVADQHRGTVEVKPLTSVELPAAAKFEAGIARIKAKAGKQGVLRVKVSEGTPRGAISAESNPISVASGPPRKRLYWGDLHVHTVESDGLGTPSAAFRYARDVADLDFCAISDHLNGLEDVIRETAASYNQAGQFVTFAAFERSLLTEAGGDLIVYFKNNDIRYRDILPGEDPLGPLNIDQLTAIVDRINARDILVVPHNHGGTFLPFRKGWAGESVRLNEMYSIWGNSEYRGTPQRPYQFGQEHRTLQEGLAAGYKFGVIASGDTHTGRGGWDHYLRSRRVYPNGLVAAYSVDLTKDGIWDALWGRSVYATTRARIILDFNLNDHPMGSILKGAPSGQPRRVRVRVEGTAEISKVEVIRNNQTVHSVEPGGLNADFVYSDSGSGQESDFYYVRVAQTDGELAWSSPIWVER